MPLAMVSRSHAGLYRRRHCWRQVDAEEAATAADEPDKLLRAPCPLTSSVPGCDVIMTPYASAFNVVDRPADLPTTGKAADFIFAYMYLYLTNLFIYLEYFFRTVYRIVVSISPS